LLLRFRTDNLPDERVFALDGQTFIQTGIIALSVIITAMVVIALLYKPVRNVIDKRKEQLKVQREQSGADMAKALAIKADYEQKLKSIEFERSAIMDEARKSAGEVRAKLLATAKEEADAVKTKAFREITAARDLIKDDAHVAVIAIASDMAAKFLAAPVEAGAYPVLFNEAKRALEEAAFKAA
jgi:F-type H+-transporting ATPase subunit b